MVRLEREEEMRQHRREMKNLSPKEREERGRAVLHLKGKDAGKGLGGRYIVKFVRKGRLPDTEISVGDLVMISENNPFDVRNPAGTVTERTGYSLSVAFENNPPDLVYKKELRMDLYVNDITFQRMLGALKSFERSSKEGENLKELLLGEREPRFEELKEDFRPRNDRLNSSQKFVAKRSLEAKDIFLVHGPPGTGKTTTLAEIIEQHVDRGFKVLATADSNVAVDNLVETLVSRGRSAVRMGHPARVTPALQRHTVDFLVEGKDLYKGAKNLRSKADKLQEKQKRCTPPSQQFRRGLSDDAIKKMALSKKKEGARGVPYSKIKSMAQWIKYREEIGSLIGEAKSLEEEAISDFLEESDVVCTTNSGCGSEMLSGWDFDLVVVDEATQSTEPACLIPMSYSEKVIMAGDHKQLPPTILSKKAEDMGLKRTLFERWVRMYDPEVKGMLSVQYRMNEKIMRFPSERFYGGELAAAPEVADHLISLKERDGMKEELKRAIDPREPLVFLDTKGSFKEESPEGSTSKRNEGEAQKAKELALSFLERGISPEEIGIISPYDDQVGLLNDLLRGTGVEIKTVDGFQGREKDIVILSFVRSNKGKKIGFLKDLRRLNVSITRARKKLIMIGDSETLEGHSVYGEMMAHVKENGCFSILEREEKDI